MGSRSSGGICSLSSREKFLHRVMIDRGWIYESSQKLIYRSEKTVSFLYNPLRQGEHNVYSLRSRYLFPTPLGFTNISASGSSSPPSCMQVTQPEFNCRSDIRAQPAFPPLCLIPMQTFDTTSYKPTAYPTPIHS